MGSIVEDELDSLSTSVTELPDEDPTGEKINPWPSLVSTSPSSSLPFQLGKSSKKSNKNNNGGVEVLPPTSSSSSLPTTVPLPGNIGGGANNSTRRIFTSAFKQTVLEAYTSDPDCIGNQRATARKFNIHRRQVQKWLTQVDKEGEGCSESSSPEQILNQGPSSLSNSSTLGTSNSNCSSSSSEKEKEVEEPLGTESQIDQSPSSSSSSSQVDLSTMSSAAMAMSLNLTHNPTSSIPNSIGGSKQLQLQFHQNHSERTRSSSPSPPQPPTQSLPSPNSLLSKFYSLYAQGQGGNNYSKYKGLNLNGDSSTNGNRQLTSPQNRVHHPPRHPVPPRHNQPRQSNGGGTNSYHIQILDEISSAYPHDDFSLLRQALQRNEVSFTKVSSSTPKSTFFPSEHHPSPANNGTSWRNNGKGDNNNTSSRTSSPSSVSPKSTLAMELLRQQTEYMRLIQQSGLNLSDLSPEGMKGNSSKYPWLSPFAQAAATLGLPLIGPPTPLNGHKKQSPPPHVFVSPKPPTTTKPKTVAAALAATRNSPNSLLSQYAAAGAFDPSGVIPKKRSTAPRKRGKPRQNPKPSCTVTRPSQEDEEFMDPTSILEVTTSSSSQRIMSNGYPPVNGNGTHFLHAMLQQQESENEVHGNPVGSPEDSEIKKYFEQQNEQKSPSNGDPDAEQITKAMALEAFTYDPELTGDCRAVARKFGLNVRVVMKWIKESAGKTNHHLPNIYDNFGLKPINGNGNGDMHPPFQERNESRITTNGDHRDDEPGRTHHQTLSHPPTSANKRKTSKPNQICDFQQEDDDEIGGFGDVPLDMMIPIKKRRVSSQE